MILLKPFYHCDSLDKVLKRLQSPFVNKFRCHELWGLCGRANQVKQLMACHNQKQNVHLFLMPCCKKTVLIVHLEFVVFSSENLMI